MHKLEWIPYSEWRRSFVVQVDQVALGGAENEEEQSGDSHPEVSESTCLSSLFLGLNMG